MNTIVTVIISAVLIWAIAMTGSIIGINIVPLTMNLILPGLIASIHIVSAVALFKESKRRMEKGNLLFAKLDPIFWALAGLAFGILGLIAFRLINDYLTQRPNQSE